LCARLGSIKPEIRLWNL